MNDNTPIIQVETRAEREHYDARDTVRVAVILAIIFVLFLALTASAHATSIGKSRIYEMPKALHGDWCKINGEDPHSDYMRGRCHKHNRLAVDEIKITADGYDAHETSCSLTKAAAQPQGGYWGAFTCERLTPASVYLWFGLRSGKLFFHADTH